MNANVSNGLMTSTPPNDSRFTFAIADFARATIGIVGLSTRAPMAMAWFTPSSPASAMTPRQRSLWMPLSTSTSATRASATSVSGGVP